MQKKYSPTDVIPIVVRRGEGIAPSLSSDVTRQLLESKRPPLGEIEVTLFENCNIECDFCFHDKKSTVGVTYEEMVSKLPIIEQHISSLQGRVDYVQLNLVGGELFQDHWMEEKCDQYYDLMVQVKEIADRLSMRIETVWVSNFLWKKHEVVRRLIDRLNAIGIKSSLIASYDLSGRPMSNRYYKNLELMADRISTVNLVATKQAIRKLIDRSDPFFDVLYSKYKLYFDDFIPDKGSDDQIPSDSELLEYYKFVADNYPNIHPVKELIENDRNEMHCLSLNKITIFPDNTTSNCRWHRYDQDDFETELNLADNTGMMQRFMDINGCLECDYYAKCGFRCYTQWDWKTRVRDLDGCVMRSFFDYIK